MADIEDIIEKVVDVTDGMIEGEAVDIINHAIENPEELEDLREELLLLLGVVWTEAIDEIVEMVNETYNEQLEDEPSQLSDAEVATMVAVGTYFVTNVVRNAFHRIHGTQIALQVEEDEREEEVEESIETAKEIAAGIVAAELLMARSYASKIESTSRGINNYVWQTMEDDRVRPKHAALNGGVYSWDTPNSAGFPGVEYGCRCYPTVPPDVNNQSGNIMSKKANESNVLAPALNLGNTGISALDVKAEEGSNKVKLSILGDIGDDWHGINTTDWQVQYLNAIDDDTTDIEVMINTRGGDLSHGVAIYNFLKNTKAKITTVIQGEASSAGSVIFMAGDVRVMPIGTYAVVHNPWSCLCGDYQAGEDYAVMMKAFAEALVEVYDEKMNISADEIRTLLDDETALISSTALAIGFSTTAEMPGDAVEASAIEKIMATKKDTVGYGDGIKPNLELNNSNTLNDEPSIEERIEQTRSYINESRQCFIDNQEENVMASSNTTKRERGTSNSSDEGVTTEQLVAQIDVLTQANTELKAELTELKAEQPEEIDMDELRATIKEELVAETKTFDDAKAKAKSIGLKDVEGDTAEDVMRNVATTKGVKNVEALAGASLETIFDFVIEQHADVETDDFFEDVANSNLDLDEDDLGTGKKVTSMYAGLNAKMKASRSK